MTGEATGIREIALPSGAEPPVRIFVNGEELREGADFGVEGSVVAFRRPLRPRPKLGLWQKLLLAIGVGLYGERRGDSLDIHYRAHGRPQVLVDVALTPREEGSPPSS